MAYPYEMFDMEEKCNKEIREMFRGIKQNWIQVGPKKFTLPEKFKTVGPEIYKFPVRYDDYWVVTFPRSGTTVTQEMIWLLQNDLDFETALKIPLVQRFPQIASLAVKDDATFVNLAKQTSGDAMKAAMLQSFTTEKTSLPTAPAGPRFFKSHIPLSLLPPNLLDTCKVVYVCRNPKDVAVSFYHLSLLLSISDFQGDLTQYWDFFERGLLRHSPYWEHIAEAWALRNHPNMLFLFYEDLNKDMAGTIRKVANHYGKQLSDEQVQRLADHLHIDNFRKMNFFEDTIARNEKAEKSNSFVRRGVTGGWKDYFTPELEARADKWIAENLSRIPDFAFPV